MHIKHLNGRLRIKKIKFRYFLRLALSFCLVTGMIIGLAAGLLLSRTNRLMIEEISRDSQNRLEKLQEYMEQILLFKFEGAFVNKVLTTVNPRSSDEIKFLLDYPREGNLFRIYQLSNDLQALHLTNEGTHNISIYFRNENYVVDLESYYERPENTSNPDLYARLDEIALNRWFSRMSRNNIGRETEVLTYVYALPFMAEEGYIKGYMIVDVDIAFLKRAVLTMLGSSSEELVIFDREGKALFSTSRNGMNRGLPDFDSHDQAWSEIDDQVVRTVLPSGSSKNGWTYSLVRPIDSVLLISRQIKQDVIRIAALASLLGFILSFAFSYLFDKPMRKLLYGIRDIYEDFRYDSEYVAIGKALDSQKQKISVLNNRLKAKHMTDLIMGNLDYAHEYAHELNRYDFRVAVVDIHGGSADEFMKRMRKMDHLVYCDIMLMEKPIILYLIPRDEKHSDTLIRDDIGQFHSLNEHIFRCSVGVGGLAIGLEHIQDSYRQALQALRYPFVVGKGSIIVYDEIVQYREEFDYGSCQVWKNSIKAGDAEATAAFLDRFVQLVKDQAINLDTIELALTQVALSLSEVAIELHLQHLVNGAEWLGKFRKDTLEETVAFLKLSALEITREMNEAVRHLHADRMSRMMDYMHQHLHEDLSLDLFAEMIHLSPSYISFLFKELKHVTFSEYLTQVRLEKATELLRQTTFSISEISLKVGYRSAQYFCTKFKVKYGMTPMQYRKGKS